ncbi:MAG: ATP-binding protein, partial [Vampirovibrionia bacterium]
TLTETFYYHIKGKNVLLASLVVPLIDNEGEFIGLVGADFKVDFLQQFIKTIQPLKGYSYLLSHEGIYIAHALRPEVIMKSFDNKNKSIKVFEAIRNDKPYMFFDTSIATKEKILRVFQPISIENIDAHWSLCVNIPDKTILANYNLYFNLIILIFVVSIVVLVLLNIITVSNIISKRLYYIVEVLNKLSKGDFNFVVDKSDSLDEIGDLQRSAELVRNDLNSLIKNLQTKEEELQTERDSLEIKVAERTTALINSLERLQKANKHKSNFLSTMSHELRTPLNAILGFSDLLDKQYYGPLNEKQDEYVKLILNSSNHLLGLISDILDIVKIDSGTIELDKQEINVNEFIEKIKNNVISQFEQKEIQFICKVDHSLDIVLIDEHKTNKAIYNLLSNALKFTNKGGKVELNIFRLNDSFFRIDVIDTGIGIDEQYKEIIFKEFYQLDKTHKEVLGGAGIGLSIVKRFVEIQGGTINVDSAENRGSCFWIELPIL